MTTIEYLTKSAGPDGCFPAGATRQVEEELARDLVARGFARLVERAPETEETATDDRPKQEEATTTSRRGGTRPQQRRG